MPRSTRVYVLRHGQSTYNVQGRFQGCCDAPVLTSVGIATAIAAAAYLQNARLEAIITSPLRRASQTAVRIFLRLRRRITEGPSFGIDSRLREIDLPQWEGRSFRSVRNEFVRQYRDWQDRPHLFHLPEQPPAVPALFERAEAFWGSLLDRFAGCNVLLVTHGGTGRALISRALGISPERYHYIQQSNGGISILEFAHGMMRPARLHAVNAVDYLGQALPMPKEAKTGLRILIMPAGAATESQKEHAARLLRSIHAEAAFADSAASREVASTLLEGAEVEIRESIPERFVSRGLLASVLWVVSAATLRRTVAELLGLPEDGALLAVAPFTVTVLHYPHPGRTPILQAMNLHDFGRLTDNQPQALPPESDPFVWQAPRRSSG